MQTIAIKYHARPSGREWIAYRVSADGVGERAPLSEAKALRLLGVDSADGLGATTWHPVGAGGEILPALAGLEIVSVVPGPEQQVSSSSPIDDTWQPYRVTFTSTQGRARAEATAWKVRMLKGTVEWRWSPGPTSPVVGHLELGGVCIPLGFLDDFDCPWRQLMFTLLGLVERAALDQASEK